MYNDLFASIEKRLPVTRLFVDSLRSDVSLQLNRLINSDCGQSKLYRKDYQTVNFGIRLPFICAFMHKANRYTQDGELKKWNSLVSLLVFEIYWRSWSGQGTLIGG